MSFDGTFIHGLINELQPQLNEGRITKIQMPSSYEIILTIRNLRKNNNLEISIHPEFQRINLTNQTIQSPIRPFPFTMILRKYLQGSIIKGIKQVGNDRIIVFNLININDLGDKISYNLILEMLGRYANIIIVNNENNKIIDLLKKENIDAKGKRILLPDFAYELPTFQQKLDPFISNELNFPRPTQDEIGFFLSHFQGLGKDTKNELQYRMIDGNPAQVWKEFFNSINDLSPTIYYDSQHQPVNFTAFPYKTIEYNQKKYSTLSEMLDVYFAEKSDFARNKQAAQRIVTRIKSLIKKDQRKINNLNNDLKKAKNAESYRIKGDLINIHLNEIKQGLSSIVLENNYEIGSTIMISLSPELSPQKNAQNYYKKYRKLQNSLEYIYQQIETTKAEIDYLMNILMQIDLADYNTLSEIETELIKEKYLKIQNPNSKRLRSNKSKPFEFKASDGTKILVGRNNVQNEKLTLHDSQKSDYWLHTKNIPGSHVIIKNSKPSPQTIYEGAMIAAYYSKSRHSAQVPVDYVQIKNIKKPNGSKPGFVIFTGQKTISVTPESSYIDKLKV